LSPPSARESSLANRSDNSSTLSGLRDRAEAKWESHRKDLAEKSPEDIARLLHELEVHQIELEMQNEELRSTQAQLEESHQRLSDLYDFAPVGYLTIDSDTHIVQANLAVATMLGVERGRLVGRRFSRFLMAQSADAVCLAQRDAPQWSGELVVRKADGSQMPVSIEMSGADEPGSARTWRCVLIDISARQAAEQALRAVEAMRASEDRYRGLADQIADGVFVADPSGRYIDANRTACDLTGYTLEELKGLKLEDLLAPDELSRLPEQLRRLQDGDVVRDDWHFKRKDGSTFVGEMVGRRLPDGRLQGVVRDVSEHRELEELQRRLHQLAMLPLEADMGEVLGAIVETAIDIAHSDFGTIQLLDRESSGLRTAAQRGFPQWWIDYCRTIPNEEGARGVALRTGERVVVEDVKQSPLFTGADLEMQRKVGVRALQATPIVTRTGEAIGVLSTHYRTPIQLGERTLLLLDLLAREAADIISYAQAEAELKRQAALLDLAYDGILVLHHGRITYWNEGAARIYGWSKEEALGRAPQDLLQTQFPESRARILDDVTRAGHWEGELVQTCRDGRRVTVDSRWSIQRDAEGEGFRVLEISSDITARTQAEQALRASEQQLQSYIDQAGDGIYVIDGESGRILSANARAAQMLGYSREELLQLSAADIESVHTPASIDDSHRRAKQGAVEIEGVHRRKDGATFPVEIRMTSLAPAPPHRILSIVRDISERKRLEQERAEEARRKDEFMAFLGHELRNPLAAIHSAVQVLSGDATPALRTRMEDIIARQTGLMRRLVDDLLEHERITHGHIQLKPNRVDLAECLQRAAASVQSTVDSRKQELLLQPPSESVQFMADGARLDQILGNLLTNASKYTGRGGRIELSGAKEAREVVIRCKDSGQGVPREYQQKIFEAFARGPKSELGYGEASIGLGLALVKQLAELHGGTVGVGSAGTGLGSEFTVRLPYVAPVGQAAAEEPQLARAVRRARSVVIVEDNPSVGMALKAALEQAGHSVYLFTDGPSTLVAVSSLKPDAFLIDIGLPGMDGYELAAALKHERHAKDALRFAVSGFTQRKHALSSAFDHYFSKPVDLPALLALLDKPPTN
jgi:PAS domain S-box-containing protein